MPLVTEHGAAVVALTIDEEGQARTAEHKVAHRRAPASTTSPRTGASTSQTSSSTPLTFPISTGQEEVRRDGIETIEAHPPAQGAASPGALHPRRVQHLVRPQPGGPAGPELGVPARVRRGRPGHGDRARVEDPADGTDPRRAAARRPSTWSTTAAARATTRCRS